jgi:hypothetical protein
MSPIYIGTEENGNGGTAFWTALDERVFRSIDFSALMEMVETKR